MTSLKAKTYIIPLLFVAVTLSLSDGVHAQKGKKKELSSDTIKADSLAQDTLKSKKRKQELNAPVTYEASDSIVFTQGGLHYCYQDYRLNLNGISVFISTSPF